MEGSIAIDIDKKNSLPIVVVKKKSNKCPVNIKFCNIIIFIVISLIASLFSLLLGSFLYPLFHGFDAENNVGLSLLYGYCSLIIMFLILIILLCICCPNIGLYKDKKFGKKVTPLGRINNQFALRKGKIIPI